MSSRRINVGIGVEASMAYGRQILRGVMEYANIRRTWCLLKEFNIHLMNAADWPACDGVIVATGSSPVLMELTRRCRYVVACSGGADPAIAPAVGMDDGAIGRLAAGHLLECRLKTFGYYGPEQTGTSLKRAQGYQAALEDRGYPVDFCPSEFVWAHRLAHPEPERWARLTSWLVNLPKPVGIFAYDDLSASTLAAACMEMGIHVPDEVAIVGVNNDDLMCESSWPPLSSIQCDFQRVGYRAAELLERLMKGEDLPAAERRVQFPPVGVVQRQSTDLLAVDDPDVASAVRYVREHACDPCSVSDILRVVPVRRRALERSFVEKLGYTPYEAILRARMKRAEELLIKTDLSILQIAVQCGFSDDRNLDLQFRKATGETPSAFRKSRKARQRLH